MGHPAATHDSATFKRDFLERLAVAEQADDASLVLQQQVSAAALDELMLSVDGTGLEDDGAFGGGGGSGSQAELATSVVMPTTKEVMQVASMFWSDVAAKRAHLPTSSLAVNTSYVINHAESQLDPPTFFKLMRLAQRPGGDRKRHTAEQQHGWERAFRFMDHDMAGTLTKHKVHRYVERHRRVDAQQVSKERAIAERRKDGGARGELEASLLADGLKARVESHVREKRSREAAMAAIEQAMAQGAPAETLFPLVTALAPPLFGCERATLWLVRPGQAPSSPDSVFGALRVHESSGPTCQYAGSEAGSFTQGSFANGSFNDSSFTHGSFKDSSFKNESFSQGSFCKESFSFQTNSFPSKRDRRVLTTAELHEHCDEKALQAWEGVVRGELFTQLGNGGTWALASDLDAQQSEERPPQSESVGRITSKSSSSAEPGTLVGLDGPSKSSAAADDARGNGVRQAASGGAEAVVELSTTSIVGGACRALEPQFIADCYADMRFDQSFDARTGFRTRTMLVVPLLDASFQGTPRHPKKPLCLGALQLINKIPSDVIPPAQFSQKDLHNGQAFLDKLGGAIKYMLPKMIEREVRDEERMLVRRQKKHKERKHTDSRSYRRRSESHSRAHHH